jgi:hypothetical protein
MKSWAVKINEETDQILEDEKKRRYDDLREKITKRKLVEIAVEGQFVKPKA